MKRTGIPHVIFCRVPMTNSEEKRLLNKYTKGIMNDPDKKWMITYRRYGNQKWQQLIKFIIQATEVREMWLCFNMNPNIIKDIGHVKFPNLILLQIWENNINSLQCLQFLFAPNLKHINMIRNQVLHVKAFRKFLGESLNQIEYINNPILTIEHFHRTKFSKQAMWLMCQSRQDPLYMNDLSTFVKMPFATLKNLTAVSMNRIRQQPVQDMMKNRFTQLDLRVRDLKRNFYQNDELKRIIKKSQAQKFEEQYKARREYGNNY